MTYVAKKNWKDLPDTSTPVTAADLIRIETGVEDAHTAVEALPAPLELGTSSTTAAAGDHTHTGFAAASHTHTAAQVSDATAVGRSVLTAADAAAARTAIGAGTSSLALGTTAATAAAGNHAHTAAQVTATAVAGGTATSVQGILDELAARIAAVETV